MVEGANTVDTRLVVTGALAETIGAAIAIHCPQIAGPRRRVVGPEILDDVVLDERVAGPAVNCEIAVAIGLVRAGVLNTSM